MLYTVSFFLFKVQFHNYLVPVLFTFYIQGVLKLKNNSGAKRLSSRLFFKCPVDCFAADGIPDTPQQTLDSSQSCTQGSMHHFWDEMLTNVSMDMGCPLCTL